MGHFYARDGSALIERESNAIAYFDRILLEKVNEVLTFKRKHSFLEKQLHTVAKV